MNKIKFELLSSALFDETAVIDISLNDNVLATDVIVQNSETTLIYDVDNFQDLNSVSLSMKNGESAGDEYIEQTIVDQGEISSGIIKSSINLTLDQIDDIVLFVYSVKISQDNGVTWEDITIKKESNAQYIVFSTVDTINNIVTNTSNIKSSNYNQSELINITEAYFGSNEALVIKGNELSFTFSKDTSNKYIDDFLIDFSLCETSRKVTRSEPGCWVYKYSPDNRSLFDSILDKEEIYYPVMKIKF